MRSDGRVIEWEVSDAIAEIRQAVVELEAIPDADLDEPTRNLRDSARRLLERFDAGD